MPPRLQVWAVSALLSCAFAVASHAADIQAQIAVIRDPDGFVNVREAPNSKSRVVLKVLKDEFFLCEPCGADWWPVRDFFGQRGYMHKSRIVLAKDLDKSEFERLFINPPRAVTDTLVDIKEANESHLFRNGRQKEILVPGQLTTSGDEVCFYNDEFKQVIYLERGTDGHLTSMFMFTNKDVADEVLEHCAVYDPQTRGRASTEKKKQYWSDLIAASGRIAAKHFRTTHGLRIGDPASKAEKLYGPAHHRSHSGRVHVLEWGYASPYSYQIFFDVDYLDRSEVAEAHSPKPIVLEEGNWSKIRGVLADESKHSYGPLAEILSRTRGSTIAPDEEMGGYGIKLFVRNERIVGILFERPTI